MTADPHGPLLRARHAGHPVASRGRSINVLNALVVWRTVPVRGTRPLSGLSVKMCGDPCRSVFAPLPVDLHLHICHGNRHGHGNRWELLHHRNGSLRAQAGLSVPHLAAIGPVREDHSTSPSRATRSSHFFSYGRSFGSRSRRVGAFATCGNTAMVIASLCTSIPRSMIERAASGTAGASDDMGWSPCATDRLVAGGSGNSVSTREELIHATIGGQPSHNFYTASTLRCPTSFPSRSIASS